MPEELESDQEKTEEPTQKRLEEAREKGDVAFSREISSVAVFFSLILLFILFRTFILNQFQEIYYYYFSSPRYLTDISIENIGVHFLTFAKQLLTILLPIILIVIVCSVFANLLQVGFIFAPEKIKPDLSKINPIRGLKRIFSIQSITELIKAILKIIIIGSIAYSTIKSEIKNVPILMNVEIMNIINFIAKVSIKLGLRISFLLIFLAGLDFGYQKWSVYKKLKMTRQELKQELKEREGDPLIRQRIRSVQTEMARRRMMEDVKKATVIITNPTHLAVALEYKRNELPAPKCVAKGGGLVAEKIKSVATEYDIPIVENKPLAQDLYKKVKIGEFIPTALYKAVAEVLAYIYKINKEKFKHLA